MKSDIEIIRENKKDRIVEILNKLNINNENEYDLYGKYIAKINSNLIQDRNKKRNLILVTAITPTKAGEGKTTTSISLVDGLNALGKEVIGCLREPSMGPVFGLKGGACGGGYAQVTPMEDINLHFTGDFHAITSAVNLISAVIDNHIYQGNELNIDENNIVWKRCLDTNDRTLRDITIGQGKATNGIERQDHFVITVATELMAILCLCKDIKDFKEKIKNILVAYTKDGKEVFLKDLKIEGSVCALMKNALNPNLVQTLEHTPVLIHGGPFANIAHGCNSLIATNLGLKLCDYVVTEAGFASDLGAEKFFDIKCRLGNLKPKCVVLVATIRALKMHGGVTFEDLNNENLEALSTGLANLKGHIDNVKNFGITPIVNINKFNSDTDKEIELIENYLKENNIEFSLNTAFTDGSKGSIDLANKVVAACEKENNFHFMYDLSLSIKEKIEKLNKEIYGGSSVEYSDLALSKLKEYSKYDNLPVCMAKTPSSFSDDPKLLNRPTGFTLHIRDLSLSLGAGFIVVYTGSVLTMPGLPKSPAALKIDVDEQGNINGIS